MLLLVLLLVPLAEAASTGARVRLVLNGAAVSLSVSEQSDTAQRVEALIVGCGIHSVAPPADRSGRPQEWQDALAGPHLYVRFPKPLRTRRGDLRISDVVVGFKDPAFIGPELSMYDGRLVQHGKCDGHRALALMCAPAIRPHLLPRQAANCSVYDRMGEPRDAR